MRDYEKIEDHLKKNSDYIKVNYYKNKIFIKNIEFGGSDLLYEILNGIDKHTKLIDYNIVQKIIKIPKIAKINFKKLNYRFYRLPLDDLNKNLCVDLTIIEISKITKIIFNNCQFYTLPSYNLTRGHMSSDAILQKYLTQISLIKFIVCEFDIFTNLHLKDTILAPSTSDKIPIEVTFEKCTIEEFNLTRPNEYDKNDEPIKLIDFKLLGGNITNFNIQNVRIANKFSINQHSDSDEKICTIKKLIINNSEFKENFKLHNCKIEEVEIKDVDFHKNADFYKSHFESGIENIENIENKENEENEEKKDIYFLALVFKGLVLFEDTIFDKKFILQFVTFESFAQFRSAKFEEGLDLDRLNAQKDINFYGAKELGSSKSIKNTSQETYRIIKHNFEKLGNKIEANKYHSLELQKHRENLKKNIFKNLSPFIVSSFHLFSSNYSRSWFLPVFWMFVVGFFTNQYLEITFLNTQVQNFHHFYGLIEPNQTFSWYCIKNIIMKSQYLYNDFWEFLKSLYHFGDSIKFTNILLKSSYFNGHFVLFAFNKAALGYLYYQFITATRKDSRK